MADPREITEKEAAKRGLISSTLNVLGKPIKVVCDPIIQVCYPVLEKHWQERYRKPWPDRFARRMLIIDFALLTLISFLAVATIATYRVLPLFPGVTNARIDAVSPSEIVSGRTETFAVSYVNDSDEMLGCSSLRVRLPQGTEIVGDLEPRGGAGNVCDVSGARHGTTVEDATGTTIVYDLGNLEPRARGLVAFDAAVYAPTGSTRVLAAELIYWEEADAAPRRAAARVEYEVKEAVLRMTAETPASLVRGRVTEVKYAYENTSSEALGPITFRLERPDDFVLTGVTLSSGANGALGSEWTVGALAPGEKGTLTLSGYFADANVTEAPVLTLTALLKDGGVSRERVLEAVRRNLDPQASGFELTQDLGGLEQRSGVVPGETVTVRVHYANRGAETFHDVRISLAIDPALIEQASPGSLSWEFPELAPGATGTAEATFRVRRMPVSGEETPELSIAANALFFLDTGRQVALRAGTAAVELPLASSVELEAAAFYYTKDGDQLGIGPLPPRVGQTTKYRVVLQVSNASGAVEGAVLEAALPPGVEWTDDYSVSNGEAIDWLPSSRRIHWRVGDMEAGAGSVGEYIGASFEVAYTPGPEDLGSVPDLLTDISLHGRDARTGLTLFSSAPAVTTDLPFDPRAAGKGQVEAN